MKLPLLLLSALLFSVPVLAENQSDGADSQTPSGSMEPVEALPSYMLPQENPGTTSEAQTELDDGQTLPDEADTEPVQAMMPAGAEAAMDDAMQEGDEIAPANAAQADEEVSAPNDILDNALQDLNTTATSAAAEEPSPQTPKPVVSEETLLYEYGPVRSGDTLMEIAQAVHTDNSIDLQQLAWGIYRKNPDAFDKGNINLLKRGVTLQVPDRAEVLAVDAKTARQEIARQSRKWQARHQEDRRLKQTLDKLREQEEVKAGLEKQLQELEEKAQSLIEENRIKDREIRKMKDKLLTTSGE